MAVSTVPRAIALESRLRRCRNVITLGVRSNFDDYSATEQEWILKSPIIYYPSIFYADLFDAMGKATFPSYHNYKCVQDKIRQTALFRLLDIPHPRTRVFYGKRAMRTITRHFDYPFVAKIARGSALGKGVFLIRNDHELDQYCQRTHAAYIQEYLEIDRDLRAVVIGKRLVHAYWRLAPPGDFRTNVAGGGEIRFDPVSREARDLALYTAIQCGFDDVGLDICHCRGRYFVIEANMKYGREGFRRAGIDFDRMMETMIEEGEI
ncbi:MAG: ATP-grasp domain-containing protein [Desulfobacterales bacterium]